MHEAKVVQDNHSCSFVIFVSSWLGRIEMKRTLFAAIAALALGGASLSAHHSFAAEFDINKPITLQGTVTKVEWVNPHVYVYLDVKDASGKVTNWALSSLSPGAARRAGVTRANFGQGQTVTIAGYHAKDSSNFA